MLIFCPTEQHNLCSVKISFDLRYTQLGKGWGRSEYVHQKVQTEPSVKESWNCLSGNFADLDLKLISCTKYPGCYDCCCNPSIHRQCWHCSLLQSSVQYNTGAIQLQPWSILGKPWVKMFWPTIWTLTTEGVLFHSLHLQLGNLQPILAEIHFKVFKLDYW